MYKAFLIGCLGFALLLAASDEGLGQGKEKKKAKDDNDKASVQDYKQIQQAKELEGKLASVDGGGNKLSFQINFPYLEKNPKYNPSKAAASDYQQWQNLYRDQVAIQQAKNPIQRQQRINQFLKDLQRLQNQAGKNPNGPFKVVNNYKEFELPMVDKVVIRKLTLGIEYDNEGQIIQRTKEDIAKLKGKDPKVPGFAAKLDELKNGQVVHLFLNPAKVDKNADKDEGIGNIPRPTVRMIVIVQEATNTAAPTGKKKN